MARLLEYTGMTITPSWSDGWRHGRSGGHGGSGIWPNSGPGEGDGAHVASLRPGELGIKPAE
jgi:hypothetical protein